MRAGIVGVGRLGGAIAFGVAHDDVWDELILCDAVPELAAAQAEDIRDGVVARDGPMVRAGPLDELRGADVVVLAAGPGRKPGMTRLDLLHANAPLLSGLARSVARIASSATLVVLTNPVDVLTALAVRASGLPRERVLGSGALLDSLRFRAILAHRFRVPPSDVEATVLGEHGDRAVPVFSRVRVGGKPVVVDAGLRSAVLEELQAASSRIIAAKGGTAFGPAGATAAVLRALVAGEPSTVPASVVLEGEYGMRDVALGVPAVLGRKRVQKVDEWELAPEEQTAFESAGQGLRAAFDDAEVLLGLGIPTVHRADRP